ncbi:hypothetical protein OUZ56_033727 [Daphnia magna]|uniref:Transposable element P transposase-like RNase H C-terminal domain-containing protein n=1 Tax=Daphnia magna TaxID=35525 RepID=A0ABQ9ZY64_9CRUS|nr:hypothetical protein OUZ56_033727 [Daphnia magna]
MKEENRTPFLSQTTLEALRLTVHSVLHLTSDLLKNDFHFVLTGKFNQDCLERFFGILRNVCGENDHPSVSTFLQLFRLLSIVFPFKDAVKKGNIDRGERLCLLATFKDCLRQKCKQTTKEAIDLRQSMKDDILDALCLKSRQPGMPLPCEEVNGLEVGIDISEISYPTLAELGHIQKSEEVCIEKKILAEKVTKDTVYQICGYLLHTRRRLLKCEQCLSTVQTKEELLPAEFYEHCLTETKSRGGLKYCTPNMFKFFHAVELIYREEVNQQNLNIGNWFQRNILWYGTILKQNPGKETMITVQK